MNHDSQTIAHRYQTAQSLLQGHYTTSLIQNDTLFPHWIAGTDSFWYERATKQGSEYRRIDASTLSSQAAFNPEELALALSKASNQTVDKDDLPIVHVSISDSPSIVSFKAFDQDWQFSIDDKLCTPSAAVIANIDEAISPDGKKAAFIRDFNIWIRDVESGEEWSLTSDGEEDYSYGGPSSAWGLPAAPEKPVQWSPDSTCVLTVRRDKREVPVLPMIDHVPADGSTRPTLSYTKVAYPGDEHIETFQLLALNLANGKVCVPNYPLLPAGFNNNMGVFFARIAWWARDCRHAYFIAQERGDRVVRLIEFDTQNGTTRVLFEEKSDTQINILASDYLSPPAHRVLSNSDELIWWSERSGWGHLYLYNLASGELIRPITSGDWTVRDVLHVDELRREIVIQTSGRLSEKNPYYRDICRVNMDTGELNTLYSVDEDTTVHYRESWIVAEKFAQCENTYTSGISPSGNYIVVTRSRVDRTPKSFLLNRDGEAILELETADISSLPKGWTWPEPVTVKAADGTTPLYGVLYRPSNFSPDKLYPVINHTSGAPWLSMVPQGSFNCSRSYYTDRHYFQGVALAELGFIVLQLDSRGTPLRSKQFQDHSYGWVPQACDSEDHASAIQQLAKRYSFMDINRVGSLSVVYHSGLVNFLLQQDLYKVHVQGRIIEERFLGSTMVGDKWEGCDEGRVKKQYAEDLVGNLRGKLLLMHPIQSSAARCYPPAPMLRVIDALQKANKDFDMLMAPGSNESYEPYATRRTWDYLIKYLMKEEPPKEYELKASLF